MSGITSLIVNVWSIPVMLYLVMPLLIVMVLFLIDQPR